MYITRDQLQGMVKETYRRYHRLACYYATGVGKSKAALNAIEDDPYDRVQMDGWGLILVNTEPARDETWVGEINQWLPVDKQAGPIDLCCYAGIRKHANKYYQWIILDEAQYVTETVYKYLLSIKCHGIIILTATEPEDPEKRKMLNVLSQKRKLMVKVDMAVQHKIVNDYRIRVWKVDLSLTESQEYFQYCKRLQEVKNKGMDFLIKKYAGERMHFIYNLDTKFKATCYLRDQVRKTGKRFIIHCGSIKMAQAVCNYTYHGETTDKDFKDFCAGKINEIASVKKLKENANIYNLQSSIVNQVNSKQQHLIQQLGRNLRLDPNDLAIMHVLIAKDTVDEDWGNKALREFNKDKITYHTIDRELLKSY